MLPISKPVYLDKGSISLNCGNGRLAVVQFHNYEQFSKEYKKIHDYQNIIHHNIDNNSITIT